MPPPPSPHPTLVVDFPTGGRLEHPLLEGADICDVITRLASVAPAPAAWTIRPANNGKVTGDPSAPRPQGDPT